VPNGNLGLSMSNEEIETSLQIRLGHINIDERYLCPATSQHMIERSGLELLKCKRYAKRRHDALSEVSANFARSVGLHPHREKVGILQDGSQARPGDVYLPTYDRGSAAALDFRVTNNKQKVFKSKVPNVAGRVAMHGEQIKNAKWAEKCNRVGVKFIPMSVDVYGYWGREARNFFFEVATRRRLFTQNDPELELKYMYQLLSMTLQRANTQMINDHKERMPADVNDDEEEEPIMINEDEVMRVG